MSDLAFILIAGFLVAIILLALDLTAGLSYIGGMIVLLWQYLRDQKSDR